MLYCSSCQQDKPVDDFCRNKANTGRFGRQSYCRPCASAKTAAWKARQPSSRKAAWNKRHYDKHHGSIRESQKDQRLRSRYGIDVAAYEAMWIAQSGCCLICERRAPLDVDHCHESDQVRGLLCRGCNLALGKVERRLWLQSALSYLEMA